MRRLTQTVAVILLILLLFSSCVPLPSDSLPATTPESTAVSQETTAVHSALPEVFRLCYSNKESMNPYKAKSITNQTLTPLLYDPLFFINESFEAVPVLAEEYTMDGTEVSVTLKSGVVFTNGTALTTSDVYTSCKLAQKNEMYENKLANIDRITIDSELSMTFHLKTNDVNFINSLDFPIIDGGTSDENSPAGTGFYRFLKNEDGAVLYANENRTHAPAAGFGQIPLLDIPDGGAIVNSLETGNISFLFDELSEGSDKRINAATRTVPMNNLIFLCANPNRFDSAFRRGVSCALSRKDIVTNGLQGNAIAATSPFHPTWAKAELAQSMEIVSNSAKAAAEFDASGNGRSSFTLLINEENSFRKDTAAEIQRQLAAFGIEVEIVTKSWEDYLSALEARSYDFFLGEIRISSNMDISPLLTGGTAEAPTGVSASAALRQEYDEYRSGTIRLEEFTSSFSNAMPFIPLCYRNGVIAYTRSLTGEMHPAQGNVFCGIESWRLQRAE